MLLSVFQEECEDVLTELVKGNYRFASLSAEWVLREWNEGKYVSPFPTEQPTEKATTSTNKSDCAAEKEEKISLLRYFGCLKFSNVLLQITMICVMKNQVFMWKSTQEDRN